MAQKSKYKAIKVNGVKIDEHRYIMEQSIGRKLNRNEVVHHINGDARDNCLKNLELMSRSNHTTLHLTGKKLNDETINFLQKYQQTKFKNDKGHSQLTHDNILQVKALLGTMRQVDIAKKLGVSKYVISRIKREVTFTYIN